MLEIKTIAEEECGLHADKSIGEKNLRTLR